MDDTLIDRYRRRIRALLELQLGMTPYTLMWYAVGTLRSKLADDLCELDLGTRVALRGEMDPRSVISFF